MIIEQSIVPSIILVAITSLLMMVMRVVGANIYDMTQARQAHDRRVHPFLRRYRKRPLVSVIVPVRDGEDDIEACIQSIVRSSYKNIEIAVVDNLSVDRTKIKVKGMISQYPDVSIRLMELRTRVDRLASIYRVFQGHCHGEIVVVLDAAVTIDRHAIRRAVTHFNTNDTTQVINAKQIVRSPHSITGLLETYRDLTINISQKSASVFQLNCYPGQCIFYKRQLLQSVLRFSAKNKRLNRKRLVNTSAFLKQGVQSGYCHYANDVIVYSRAPAKFRGLLSQQSQLSQTRAWLSNDYHLMSTGRSGKYKRLLALYHLLIVIAVVVTFLLAPPLITYFIYLAVRLHEPTLLVLVIVAVTAWLLFAVWGDEDLRWRQKIVYSFGIPITYGALYLATWLKIFSLCRLFTNGGYYFIKRTIANNALVGLIKRVYFSTKVSA